MIFRIDLNRTIQLEEVHRPRTVKLLSGNYNLGICLGNVESETNRKLIETVHHYLKDDTKIKYSILYIKINITFSCKNCKSTD